MASGKAEFFLNLNSDPTELHARSTLVLCLVIQIKEFLEKADGWLNLQINLVEYLKLTLIVDGVGAQVLRPDSKEVKYIPEEFGTRGTETSIQMVTKYNDLILSRLRMDFFLRGSPFNLLLGWE